LTGPVTRSVDRFDTLTCRSCCQADVASAFLRVTSVKDGTVTYVHKPSVDLTCWQQVRTRSVELIEEAAPVVTVAPAPQPPIRVMRWPEEVADQSQAERARGATRTPLIDVQGSDGRVAA
jgi:hypothetical protein